MIAPLAKEDYEDLKGQGLEPTLEDFDRLNCLALPLQCGEDTTSANFPRIGWAEDIPFYQPTCAAYFWYLQFAIRHAEDQETRNTFWYFALAHGRIKGFFDNLHTRDAIEEAVSKWVGSLHVTREEITRAARYAVEGYYQAIPGKNPRQDVRKRKSITDAAENLSILQARLNKAVGALKWTWDELMVETPSHLDEMVMAVAVENGRTVTLNEAKLLTDYKFALLEIKTRLLAEKEAKDGKRN